MLKVEWMSSGNAGPDHSFNRIPPSDGPDGPSQTLRISWPTSVSKTIKCRLRKHKNTRLFTFTSTDLFIYKKASFYSSILLWSITINVEQEIPQITASHCDITHVHLNYLIVFPVSASIVQVQWRLLSYGAGYPGDRIRPDTAPVMWPPHSATRTGSKKMRVEKSAHLMP